MISLCCQQRATLDFIHEMLIPEDVHRTERNQSFVFASIPCTSLKSLVTSWGVSSNRIQNICFLASWLIAKQTHTFPLAAVVLYVPGLLQSVTWSVFQIGVLCVQCLSRYEITWGWKRPGTVYYSFARLQITQRDFPYCSWVNNAYSPLPGSLHSVSCILYLHDFSPMVPSQVPIW